MTIIEKLDMNVKQANSDFTAIKNKIIEKGVEVAEGTRTAYYAKKVDEVYEAGRKAEYDEFWDSYQNGGNRLTLDFFFAGNGWYQNTIIPKYDLKPARANNMFTMTTFAGDLAQHFEDLGRALDFSNCTMVHQIFANATDITRLGTLDFRKVTYGSSWFISMRKLITIDKLMLSEDTTAPGYAFDDCSNLENLTIEGVINKNGYNFKACTKLSKASIESIMAALSTATSGLTVTLSKTAVNNAFTDEEWTALVSQHTNWTISLI